MSNVAQIASPGSGVFSMKVYKVCSVLDVRLLFLRDWSFKSECECDLWRPPLPETIGLPKGRVLCILVIVKNYGIIGDFAKTEPLVSHLSFHYNCYDLWLFRIQSVHLRFQNRSCYLNRSYQDATVTIDCY